MYRKLTFRAGTEALAGVMIDANAPAASTAALDPTQRVPMSPYLDVRPEAYTRLGLVDPAEMGSNAIAYGGDVTDNGRGLLLGNPHFPWTGIERWYQSHITVRGEYDVAGASLHGVPVINIGFNGHLAWSHTVSATRRFVFYELTLDPADPLRYLVDGESRAIERIPVTAEERMADGTVETRTETIYMTEYGPVIDGGALSALAGGWPITLTGTILAVRDVNLDNTGLVEAWVEMGQAQTMDEFEEALRPVTVPWVNTVAADRDGQAYFGDATRAPGVTAELRARCASRNFGNILYSAAAIMALNGSRTECELVTVRGTAEGVLPYDQLPHLRTTQYAGNANDTYWLANPEQLFEGISPALGPSRYEQRVRTRQMFVEAEARLAGTDGRGPAGINIEQIKDMMFSSTSHAATPWEDLQFRVVGDERIPIHGMDDKLGFSVIGSRLEDGVGYIPTGGNSYIQAVTWDDTECPEAYALLVYSLSSDPASPFYADQTRAYSEGTWPAFPFCEAEVRAARVTSAVLVGP